MILFFFIYLIILILPGETIFQLSFLKKKEKISQFSIIEHLIYIIIIGLSVSSTICLFLAIFRILNLVLLILINLVIFIISIFFNIFNKKLINKNVLIFRIISYLKSKETFPFIDFVKKNFLSIISGIVFFFTFFLILISFKYIPNHDVWYFTQWAIDLIKYSPDIFYSTEIIDGYLGDILYVKFQNYYLASFLLFDIELWHFLIKYILPFIPLICLFLFIINFTAKNRDRKEYIPIILLFSSLYLLNWFFYASPINFSIVIGLLLINSSFDKNKRSYILIIILAIYMYLFHSVTMGLFAISYFFTLISLFLIKLQNKEKRREFGKFLMKNRILITFSISISIILLSVFLNLFSDQIIEFLINRQQIILIDYQVRSAPPSISDWVSENVGIHVIILSLLSILFIYPMIKNNKTESYENLKINNGKIYILLFFWILLIEIVIICAFFPFWYMFSGIPYLFYRYFIYLDLACVILAPFSFQFLIKCIQSLRIDEKERIRNYFYVFILSFFIITVILIGRHSIRNYYLETHYRYVPEEYIDTYFWLKEVTPSNSIYFISPYTKVSTVYQHCILDDNIFINQSLGLEIFNDSLYFDGFNDYYNNTFREYIFIMNKPIDTRWAYSHSIPENYTNKTVDYIIIDDYYNNNLTNLLLQDTFFFELMHTFNSYDHFIMKNYTVYVFHTISNNYDF